MTMFDRDQFDECLEAYLDGELPVNDARRFEAFADVDEDAGRELRFAQMVRQRLDDLPKPVCPPDVTRAVLSTARADARRSIVPRLRNAATSSWGTIMRPALIVGVFVGVVVAGALVARPPAGEPPIQTVASDEATPQEIEQGLNDAKWALAYLSNVGRRTATTIRDDVLHQHVVQPVNRALSDAFDDHSDIQ